MTIDREALKNVILRDLAYNVTAQTPQTSAVDSNGNINVVAPSELSALMADK